MADYAAATIEWGSSPDTTTLLELLKDQLGITGTDQDTELSMYLQMAGEAAERYIDNVIASSACTQKLKRCRTPIRLCKFPYIDDLTVTVDGVDVTADWEVISEDGIDYVLSNRYSQSRGTAFEQVVLTYNAGYTPLPTDIGFAIVQTAMTYEVGGAQGGAIERESVTGVGTIQYSDAGAAASGMIPASAVAVLDRYRRYDA